MSFLLDVLTRRSEVAHASNPNYDEQSKENSTNSYRSNWVHGGEMWLVWIVVMASFSCFRRTGMLIIQTLAAIRETEKGSQAAHLLIKVRLGNNKDKGRYATRNDLRDDRSTT